MSLRYALLALLTAAPMTGYEASKRFAESVGHVWYAPDSQIYPELKRMAAEGLLVGIPVPWGSKSVKTQYAITQEGREALKHWLCEVQTPARRRDPSVLRAAYLDQATPEAARAQLQTTRRFHEDQLATLEAIRESLLDGTHPTLRERFTHLPPQERERVMAFRVYAHDGMIAQERAALEWVRQGEALLDQWMPREANGRASS